MSYGIDGRTSPGSSGSSVTSQGSPQRVTPPAVQLPPPGAALPPYVPHLSAPPRSFSPVKDTAKDFTAIMVIPELGPKVPLTPGLQPRGFYDALKLSLLQTDFSRFSGLVDSTLQCGVWQYMSDYLVSNTSYGLNTVGHWGLTGTASGSTALLRGVVNCMKDAYSNKGVNVSEICVDTVVLWVSECVSNTAWQPAYNLAIQYFSTPGMEFVLTGAISAVMYFAVLIIMRLLAGSLSKNYDQKKCTSQQFANDIVTTLLQVFPVATYFVQTNCNYFISALATTNSPWLNAARAAATGAMGYAAGYVAGLLLYFLQYALGYLTKVPYFVNSMFTALHHCCMTRPQLGYAPNDGDNTADDPLLMPGKEGPARIPAGIDPYWNMA